MNGRPNHPRVVDWATLLPILQSYRRLAHIGAEAGMSEKTINRLKRGEIWDPHFSQGLRLLDLAVDYLTAEEWARVKKCSEILRGRGGSDVPPRLSQPH